MKEYYQYKLAKLLSTVVPRKFAYWIALRLAGGFCSRDRRGREAVIANLRRVLTHHGLTPGEEMLEGMARDVFRHFGKYLVDFFRFSAMSEREIRRLVSIENVDVLEKTKAMNKGTLLVTAHLGNWELGGCALAALGCPIYAVVLPQPVEKLNRMFQGYRERRGMTIIPLGNSVRHILRLLKQNQYVALLADRDYGPHDVSVPFFGAPARLPRGPAWLSCHSGAPLVPTVMLRREDDTFLMRLHPPIVPDRTLSCEEMHRRLCRVMEEEIAKNPTQWLMFENVWDGKGYGQGTAGAPPAVGPGGAHDR